MLYKYRNYNNDDGTPNSFIDGILHNGEMFFAKPSTFEDVHDCEIVVDLYAQNSKIRQFWKNELFAINPRLEDFYHSNGFWGNPQLFAKDYTSRSHRIKNNADVLGIHCLCKNPKIERMWSKYASNQGLCIGYKTENYGNSTCIRVTDEIKLDGMIHHYLAFLDVNYDDENLQPVNRLPSEKFSEEVQKSLLRKKVCWSFEDEVRSFVHNGNIGKPLGERGIVIHCAPDVIGEIIFAVDILPVTVERVVELIDSRPCGRNGVAFYQISPTYDNLISINM